jgi:hypothetical protein
MSESKEGPSSINQPAARFKNPPLELNFGEAYARITDHPKQLTSSDKDVNTPEQAHTL